MSKFIRTKDTIFEVVEETDIVYRVKAKSNPNNIYAKSKCQTIVLEEANELKDLCDEFVVKIKTGYLITYYDKKLLTQDAIKNGADVYGAIWTNKGLIFVARMNNEGVLELL